MVQMERRTPAKAPNVIEVGHRELRENLRGVLDRLTATGKPSVVTNRRQVEAVMVTAETFDALEKDRAALAELRGLVPMLVAAVAAGAAIPSETLSRLGVSIPFDWRALNRFQAAYPIRITQDEEGHPIDSVQASDIRVEHFEEADDELES